MVNRGKILVAGATGGIGRAVGQGRTSEMRILEETQRLGSLVFRKIQKFFRRIDLLPPAQRHVGNDRDLHGDMHLSGIDKENDLPPYRTAFP